MKTAVSIPDDVFADAERLARAMNISRSRLYSRAVREYVARHAGERVTESLNGALEAVGEKEDSSHDFCDAAARSTLRRSTW